jgi:hypothetical protein
MIIKIIKKKMQKKLFAILLFFCLQTVYTEIGQAPVIQKKEAKKKSSFQEANSHTDFQTDCQDHEEDDAIEELPPFTIPPFDFTTDSLDPLDSFDPLKLVNDLEAEIISQELEEEEAGEEITTEEKSLEIDSALQPPTSIF